MLDSLNFNHNIMDNENNNQGSISEIADTISNAQESSELSDYQVMNSSREVITMTYDPNKSSK